MSDVSQGPGWWQASDGKWYPPEAVPAMSPPPPPPPPAWQKPKRRVGCLSLIGGAVVLLIVLVIIIAVLASVGTKSTITSLPSSGGAAPAAGYTVGQTANTSGFQITVYSFKDPQPPVNSFNTPTAGDHYVSVDVQVTNPGSSQQSFSSVLGFHLLDAQNHQYDEDITNGSLTPGAPDGQIAGGQSIRGFVVFEVPDGTTGLSFRAQGSITAAGAVWTL